MTNLYYIVKYTKECINGINNVDMAEVHLDQYGHLKDLHVSYFGLIDSKILKRFDYDKITKGAIDLLYNKYGDYINEYHNYNFEVTNVTVILLSESKYGFNVTLEATEISGDSPFTPKWLERVIVKVK